MLRQPGQRRKGYRRQRTVSTKLITISTVTLRGRERQ
jgi:hypothetical protein